MKDVNWFKNKSFVACGMILFLYGVFNFMVFTISLFFTHNLRVKYNSDPFNWLEITLLIISTLVTYFIVRR